MRRSQSRGALCLFYRLLYVFDYVVGVLDAQGDSYQVLLDPETCPSRWGEFPVRGCGRVYRQGVDVAETRNLHAELERIQKAERLLAASIGYARVEFEGDEAAGPGQRAAGDFVIRVVL